MWRYKSTIFSLTGNTFDIKQAHNILFETDFQQYMDSFWALHIVLEKESKLFGDLVNMVYRKAMKTVDVIILTEEVTE